MELAIFYEVLRFIIVLSEIACIHFNTRVWDKIDATLQTTISKQINFVNRNHCILPKTVLIFF